MARPLAEDLADVSENLLNALLDTGISSLTPVQRRVLPLALSGRDVLAKAKTGTGKTMAFLIPCVAKLLAAPAPGPGPDSRSDPVRVLVLSGTRELAAQIVSQAERLTSHLEDVKLDYIIGGTSVNTQKERLDPNFQVR